MGKNTNTKRDRGIEESDEKVPFISSSVQDYVDKIEEMFNNIPDKRKKEYKVWKDEINELIKNVNRLTKPHKNYNPVK